MAMKKNLTLAALLFLTNVTALVPVASACAKATTVRKLKVMFGQLYDYAIMHEIISKERDLVQYVDISNVVNPNAFDRKPFS
ncbi:hypothetical protein Ana3638_07390 [Anaerocolumna sedimenticola]|uniref:Uncharacterized protein n=1 Tax=Anaerocolumna sedimenticola TaxID=2696063 RepID=A0A6P1TLS9_9FIRM|nr:hypothetical protein [Anaerocolumna sedimenticola]QHQ60615.1 hypothetical protein Ana3638_07390 [Anaerocolumna sedimenticola]